MINILCSGDGTLTINEDLKKIIRGKKLRRNELSRLPFKDKIDILIHLQKMAKGIKKPGKEKNRVVWKI